jgi:Tfp pilus assembly protein PilP
VRVFVRAYILVIAALVSVGAAAAQEKTKTSSPNARESVERLLHTPAAISKSVDESAQAAKVKLDQMAIEGKNSTSEPPSTNGSQSNPANKMQPSPSGRRDPFRPFTLNVRPNIRRRENLSPLERYDLGQLKLVGIIWNSKEPTAMVEDSAGLGYVVKIGTPIGASDGTVKSIKQNEIIIEEFFVDLYGAKKRREVNMRVSPENLE